MFVGVLVTSGASSIRRRIETKEDRFPHPPYSSGASSIRRRIETAVLSLATIGSESPVMTTFQPCHVV